MRFRLFLTTLILLFAHAASAELLVVATIENIGKPYEYVRGVCVYQEAKGFSFKVDPIEGAMNAAFEQIEVMGAELGANGFIGADLDFENRSAKDEGRVILCGTFVKILEDVMTSYSTGMRHSLHYEVSTLRVACYQVLYYIVASPIVKYSK